MQADNCVDADIIYSFLDANGIGRTHSTFYISYALYMESKNKIKAANEIFDLGISRYVTLTLFQLLSVVIVPFNCSSLCPCDLYKFGNSEF